MRFQHIRPVARIIARFNPCDYMITFSYNLLSGGIGGGSSPVTSPYSGIPTPVIAFSTLALDPATGSLAIPVRILRGPDACIQKLRSRFRLFKGEWFLDQRIGIPYKQKILVKNPDPVLINAIFRKVILGTPGFASLDSFDAQKLDRARRELTVNFQATLVDGTTVIAQAEPFLV